MNAYKEASQDEILTVSDVAEYLKLSERTILNMVSRGEIPAAKIASQWRFFRPVVQQWVKAQMMPSNSREQSTHIRSLRSLISRELIFMDIKPGSKEQILDQLLTPLATQGVLPSKEPVLTRLIARERLASTGIGNGVAIPHLRERDMVGAADEFIAVGICPQGTDYQSVDGAKTRLFFLPFAGSDETHLRALTAVARIAQDVNTVSSVSKMQSAEAIYETITHAAIGRASEV